MVIKANFLIYIEEIHSEREDIVPNQASTLRCVMSFAAYIILIDCILNFCNNSVSLGFLLEKKWLFCAPSSASCT